MLTARTEDGRLITLSERTAAINMRNGHHFFCPACAQPVKIKAGAVRIPHFAHERNTDCLALFSEPESLMHLQGKRDLAELFVRNGYTVELEPYLKKTKQRPDLLVEQSGSRFAVEYQCSPISAETIAQRTDGYKNIGIYPLWILGGPPYQTRKQTTFFLTDFQFSLVCPNRNGQLGLSSYDPRTNLFHYLSHLTPFTRKSMTAILTSTPLKDLRFPIQLESFDKPLPSLRRWFSQRKRWLENRIRYGSLINDPFLRTIYEKGFHPSLLPAAIGIPSSWMEAFQSPPIIWQFFLWADVFTHLKKGRRFSALYLEQKMSERLIRGDVRLRPFPLEARPLWKHALAGYCNELLRLGYITRSGELFVMLEPIIAPKTIEEAQKEEERVLSIRNRASGLFR